MDHLQAEANTLQQQALATQQSIKKLQTRESAVADHAILYDAPGLASIDSTLLGVGSSLALAAIAAWWYLWHRPRTRWIDAPPAPKAPAVNAQVPLSQRGPGPHDPGSTQSPSRAQHDVALAWDSSTVSGDTTQSYESGHSPFARHEPNREFDPEAAASEVTRVRKSLANKRHARSHLQDRTDPVAGVLDLDLDLGEPPPASGGEPISVRSGLNGDLATAPQVAMAPGSNAADLDLDLDLGPWQTPAANPTQEPAAPLSDEAISFSLEPTPLVPRADDEAEAELAPEPELAPIAPAQTPMPYTEPTFELETAPQDSGTKGYDFTITLALAQESAALELWNEARDLASEVLESDDPKLVSEALSLLERLNQLEMEAPDDSPPLNGVR